MKEQLSRLTICSHCILTICDFSYSRFGFEGWIWGLIASVPGLCTLFTSKNRSDWRGAFDEDLSDNPHSC